MDTLREFHGVEPEDYEELRLAVVMNGGVSLAVWIGGVANEFNRALRGESAYGELLELTASAARADVISGTSAGGINGALLALAQVYGTELAPLRAVWLDDGAFTGLLRDPSVDDPPSILRGNDYFLPRLREAFRTVRGSGPARSPDEVPIALTLTTTLLHGEPKRIADDFGNVIADVEHRGRFVFVRGQDPGTDGEGRDDFDQPQIAAQLAFAARSTASFPVAFEPLYCAVESGAQPLPSNPHMGGLASFRSNRFLLDGGILDNKPLESAIDAIFGQRAEREVRRVLCYVVPVPGETAQAEGDDPADLPTMGGVALASLVQIPSSESISAQLEAVVEHNRRVRHKRSARLTLARSLGYDAVRDIARQLFPVYRQRRMEGAFEHVLGCALEGAADAGGDTQPTGRRRREWLLSVLGRLNALPWVPDGGFEDALAATAPGDWRWGAITIRGCAELAIDLLRRGLLLAAHEQRDLRARLRELRRAGYAIIAATPLMARTDRRFWSARGAGLAEALRVDDPRLTDDAVLDWMRAAIRAWDEAALPLHPGTDAAGYGPAVPSGDRAPPRAALGWVAFALADLVVRAAPLLRTVARAASALPRASGRRAALDLATLLDFVAPEGTTTGPDVLARLLALEVAQYAISAHPPVRDQFVELVQVSANGPTAFGGASSAHDKLAGAQMANFGGFYKKSWRANDWLYGRLDGSERLVRILLNPQRLLRLYMGRRSAAEVAERIAAIARPADRDDADALLLEARWRAQRPDIERELAFLDDPDRPLPEQLPLTARAVVTRLHLAILRDELPVLAGAIEDDQRSGDHVRHGAGANLLAGARRIVGGAGLETLRGAPPERLIELFESNRIGVERFADQAGSDLFTTTASRTLAVTVTALSGERAGIAAASTLLKPLRYPLLIADAMAQTVMRQSRTATALLSFCLALGLAVTVLLLWPDAVVPQPLGAVGYGLLVLSVALLVRRYWRLLVLWLLFALLAAIAWSRGADTIKAGIRLLVGWGS